MMKTKTSISDKNKSIKVISKKNKKIDDNNSIIDYLSIIKQNTYSISEKKKILSFVDSIISQIKSELKKNGINAQVILGGSSAKGTFLKGEFDCDVFVRFMYEYRQNNENLSNILEPVIKKVSSQNYERVHGSRDYFKLNINNIDFEIIPVLYVKSPKDALNITDSSPLHVDWIKKKIEKNKKIINEIILTKIFLKANNLYGAESYIRGFSGHVIDILISYYGSFDKLMSECINWNEFDIIDVEKYYHSSKDVLKVLNSSKISPLIVIDPVEKERNAAASLSVEKFKLIKSVAESYIKSPSISFFSKKYFTVDDLKKDSLNYLTKNNINHSSLNSKVSLFIYEASPLKGKKDVVGSKLLKTFEKINSLFNENDFKIIDKNWQWNKDSCLMWFYISNEKLSPYKVHLGPPVKSFLNATIFKKKHSDVFEKDGRLYAKIKRQFKTSSILAKTILIDKYILERVNKIKLIK